MTNEWGGKPLPVSATCHHAGRLAVRLSGAAPAVEAAARQDRRRAMLPDGDALLAEHSRTDPSVFRRPRADGAPLWRLSVKPTAPSRTSAASS